MPEMPMTEIMSPEDVNMSIDSIIEYCKAEGHKHHSELRGSLMLQMAIRLLAADGHRLDVLWKREWLDSEIAHQMTKQEML